MTFHIRHRLFALSTLLLGCLIAFGILSWINSRQLGASLNTAGEKLRDLAADSSQTASQLAEESRQLGSVVDEAAKAAGQERAATLSALAETACKLMDRRVDNAKFLADALAKSNDLRRALPGFLHASCGEAGFDAGEFSGTSDPWDDLGVVQDQIAALSSSAGADFYAIAPLDGPGARKIVFSNQKDLYGLPINAYSLALGALGQNRITKGYDRFGKRYVLGSATPLRDAAGRTLGVLVIGYTLDTAALRFLSSDLQAGLALYLPEPDGSFRLLETTITDGSGTLVSELPAPPDLIAGFLASLSDRDPKAAVDATTLRTRLVAVAPVETGGISYLGAFQGLPTEDGKLGALLYVARDVTSAARQAAELRRRTEDAVTKAAAIEQEWKVADDAGGASANPRLEAALTLADSSRLTLEHTLRVNTLGILAALILGGGAAYAIARSITRPLGRLVVALSDSALRTRRTADTTAENSRQLAEGTAEQAAALEQTSSALEQLSGMTNANAEAADKAKTFASEARRVAETGAEDVGRMNEAMRAIETSSAEIAKILKTIDEIAFQTNILALNAAVEAARAGSAGAGFAVVADEVRNLAQRSAQAARDTAGRIEASVAASRSGIAVSAKVAESLRLIVEQNRGVDGLVAEIARASREQAGGISQSSSASAQMDKNTQRNAAHSQESAEVARQLQAESSAIDQAVAQLRLLAGLADQTKPTPPPPGPENTPPPEPAPRLEHRPAPQAPRHPEPVTPGAPTETLHFN
jgi:methyl-accepting chemotaxis protein